MVEPSRRREPSRLPPIVAGDVELFDLPDIDEAPAKPAKRPRPLAPVDILLDDGALPAPVAAQTAAVSGAIHAMTETALEAPAYTLPPPPTFDAPRGETKLLRPPLELTRPAQSWLWMLGCGWLAAALLLQFALLYRNEIARDHPNMKPKLQTLCKAFGCEVSLWKDAERMTIEMSDLQLDPAREREIIFTAAVRNRAPFAQAYPSLELTLTDGRDQALVRKILNPPDYLDAQTDPRQGLAPNSEANVKLRFSTGSLKPIGYRLLVFYP
jgi:hypothetical protein